MTKDKEKFGKKEGLTKHKKRSIIVAVGRLSLLWLKEKSRGLKKTIESSS